MSGKGTMNQDQSFVCYQAILEHRVRYLCPFIIGPERSIFSVYYGDQKYSKSKNGWSLKFQKDILNN